MVRRNLVTGGAGFLGSHLCDRLMQAGEEVICLDNYFTGRKDNVRQWIGHPRFELIRHDVTDPIRLEVDRIWHLACPASPVHYQFNPIKTAKTSFLGTYNMLGLARRVKARLLLASTSEVYGDPEVHPQPETYWGNVNPIGPRGVYDEAKRYAEALTMAYHRQQGVNTAIVRIFNTYGPRMRAYDGRAIPTFLRQALAGKSAARVHGAIEALDEATRGWAGRRMDAAIARAIGGKGVGDIEASVARAQGVEAHLQQHEESRGR